MTALSSLLFSCFQAFFAALARPSPLPRPSFVTNLLHQPVSDLFQFYAAFPLPSRLISFSVIFSLPSRLIPFFAVFSLPSCLILDFFFATFSASIILSVYILLRDHSSQYFLHTPKESISSPNATLSVDSDKQKAPALR